MVAVGVFLLELVVTNERPEWLAWISRFALFERTSEGIVPRGEEAPWRALGSFTTEALRLTRIAPGDAFVVTQRGWQRNALVLVAASRLGGDLVFRATFAPAPVSTVLFVAVLAYGMFTGDGPPGRGAGAVLGVAVGYAILAVYAHRTADDVARAAITAIEARLASPDAPVVDDRGAHARGRAGLAVLALGLVLVALVYAARDPGAHLDARADVTGEDARVLALAAPHADLVGAARRAGRDPMLVGARGLARLPAQGLIVHHDLELSLAHQDRVLCTQIALGTIEPSRMIRALGRLSDPQITQWYTLLREAMRLELADEGPAPAADAATFDRIAERMLADLPTDRRDALAQRIAANADPCDGYLALDEGMQRLTREDRLVFVRLLYARAALARVR